MTQRDGESIRADLWLWAARFFKTRRLSREAIDGGKVEVNGVPCKPAKTLKPGDTLRITRGEERFEVHVEALSRTRGPASAAQLLYSESPASREARVAAREQRRLIGTQAPPHRPDKQARRALRRLKGNH